MSKNYKFHNPEGVYFVSFAVIEWIDALSRKEYKDIIVESLAYCQREKGMKILAWCIMSNHVHLIFRSTSKQKPELLLGDLKRHTSKSIVSAIKENSQESRREWILEMLKKVADKSSNVKEFQFWRHDNKPIEIWSNKVIDEKINYIHNNPVEEGVFFKAEDYRYSSAIDYSGGKGILNGITVIK